MIHFSPHLNYICAAYSVLKFVKTWNLLFHTFSFLGFKGILFTSWHCRGFGIELKLSIQDVMNTNFFLFFLCEQWCVFWSWLSFLGINLHGSIDVSSMVRLQRGYLRRRSKPDGQITVETNVIVDLLICQCWVLLNVLQLRKHQR